ncbi:MAG: PEP-CTERM sorting domain-containing protein [Phycisphaeraceae bacterium]
MGFGATQYTASADYTIQAQGHIVSSNPDTFTGPSINNIVGADRFYNAGFTGSGVVASNIEAGHAWSGHSTLGHISAFVEGGSGSQLGEIDRHATWAAHAMGGRNSGLFGSNDFEAGIAPGADLRSGAIATSWSGTPYSLSFSISAATYFSAYASSVVGFGAADVINSSWGFTDPTGTNYFTSVIDGLAAQNPNTTQVFSAGNNGAANTVGGAGSGYNSITVGALENGGNSYDQIVNFSSHGPQDYFDNVSGLVTGVRAPVDIAAPGQNLTLAFYGGATGGNAGGTTGGGPTSYSGGVGGTSFSAPIVAGGVALMKDAADSFVASGTGINGSGSALPSTATDTRVIKAALLNAADKVRRDNGSAWDNGQSLVSGVVTTTQSLDYESGAGGMNLDKTFDQYLTGQTDILGTAGGVSAEDRGWDYATVGSVGQSTDIVLTSVFEGGTEFTATLAWFRDRETNASTSSTTDLAYADLDLQIWDATFTTLIAESISDYNPVEHLHFTLDSDTALGLRVNFDEMRFGTENDVVYGLAWNGTLIPEPSSLILLCFGGLLAVRRRRDQAHGR